MGVLPLNFMPGENAETLGLDGTETFTIRGVADMKPRQEVVVEVTAADGSKRTITTRCRIDTYNELEYFRAGGILHYVLRRLAAA
jgi:aconitate hydratase